MRFFGEEEQKKKVTWLKNHQIYLLGLPQEVPQEVPLGGSSATPRSSPGNHLSQDVSVCRFNITQQQHDQRTRCSLETSK